MPSPQLTEKTLDIIEAVAALGTASMPQIQERCRLPLTTTHRIMQSLLRRGFVMRTGRANYQLGSSIVALANGRSIRDLLPAAARVHLRALSKKTRSHVHLGIFEDGMVTYLVKQRFGRARLHSAEGMQLEAYCSALGKVLLSGLPDDELAGYAGEGELIALTPKTITDPVALQAEIGAVRARGWASDDEEIAIGLQCVAVPVSDKSGRVLAAISVSTFLATRAADPQTFLPWLVEASRSITHDLFSTPDN